MRKSDKAAYTPEVYARRLAASKAWRDKNREHLHAYDKKRNAARWADPAYKTIKHLDAIRYNYGLSSDAYLKLLQEQDNKCRICGKPPKNRRLAVDHNHQTNQVRGLLCASCNGKLAWFENRRSTIETYLNKEL